MENVIDYLLDGLEQALELERELGVRTVEVDRTLLASLVDAESFPRQEKSLPVPVRRGKDTASAEQAPQLSSRQPPQPLSQPQAVTSTFSSPSAPSALVFLHDRPLSPGGVEMMAKIIHALGRTEENSPIVVVPPTPRARITVVLGGLALKKYFPGMKGEPGQWIKSPNGDEVLITYSPEYILRFGTVTPAVQKLKQDMWRSLKAVAQRLS